MPIPTEPIGSIPGPLELINALKERRRLGVHTCPGGDCDSTHSADVDYAELQLGTTDDCGFAPFSDDTSTSREKAFAKIRTRVEGTAMAAKKLGVA